MQKTGHCAPHPVTLDWLMRRMGERADEARITPVSLLTPGLTSLQLPTVQSDGHRMSLLQDTKVLGFSRCWQSWGGRACSSEPMVWMHSTVRFFSPWGPHVVEHASHSPAHHLQTHMDMWEKISPSQYTCTFNHWIEIQSRNADYRVGRSLKMFQPSRGRSADRAMAAAATAAKSLQSCLTLCDPIDDSPPGSPVPGILQARTLEWVAISFSNAWKGKVKGKSLSRVRLLACSITAMELRRTLDVSRW